METPQPQRARFSVGQPATAAATSAAVPARPAPSIGASGLGAARGGVPLWLPLPFLITGPIGAALFSLLLPFVAPQALVAAGFPHVLALVHIATLGWLTMTIMGASLQLAPVIVVSPLRAAHFWPTLYPHYAIGVALMVVGFWFGRTPVLIVGGILVVTAALHYVIILLSTLLRAEARPLSKRFLLAATGYLCAVVSLGLTAALNFQFGFLGAYTSRLLLAHITIGVVGWLTSTLMGVSYTLMPMFALVHGQSDQAGRRVFVLLNVGALGMAAGFALDWAPVQALFALTLIGAILLFGWDYRSMLRTRKRKSLDITQRHAIAGVCYLVLLAVAAPLAAVTGVWQREPVVVALALAAFVGWLGQSAIGYLYKIVPFLIWQSRYGPRVGREPVPLMRDLIWQRGASASWLLINVGLPLTIICAVLGWLPVLQIAAALLAAGMTLAALNIVRAIAPRRSAALIAS